MDIKFVIFCVISAITLLSAGVVAFSRNVIHSAFALLGVFAGVMGLYILLSADFVAIVQLVIYIGGILVLIIFAVMLTTRIDKAGGERKLVNKAFEPLPALVLVGVFGAILWAMISKGIYQTRVAVVFRSTTAYIGDKLLDEYLLPFEIISILLVLVLVGAVVLGRKDGDKL